MSVTLKDIAARCGLSMQSVSIAMKEPDAVNSTGGISAKTRARVRRIAVEMGYTGNLAASCLRGGTARAIGIIQPLHVIGCYNELLRSVNEALLRVGYVTYMNVSRSPEDIPELIRQFISRNVDGVMLLQANNSIRPEDWRVPVLPVCEVGEHFKIGIDLKQGGAMATRHLAEHGHRRIGYLGAFAGPSTPDPKLYGYRAALSQCGLEQKREWEIVLAWNEKSRDELENAIQHDNVDAWVCANDFIAGKLIYFLRRHGFRVPEDIAVTGFDGLSFAEFTVCSLTTVIQPMTPLAERSVEMLLQRIGGMPFPAEPELIAPQLHIGRSCGCTPQEDDIICWENTFQTLEAMQRLAVRPVPEHLKKKSDFHKQ